MRRFIVVVVGCVLALSSCKTLYQMEDDIYQGFEKASDRLPKYEIMIVPVNDVALEIEAKKGREWVVPE